MGDEWEAKEFPSYGKFCHQISPHAMMKSQCLDRELEVLQRPDGWPALEHLGGDPEPQPH